MSVFIQDRYYTQHYNKRINQNRIIKDFLLKTINRHKEKSFPWTMEELINLNYEDLLEILVAAINPACAIVLGVGRDWSCGRDAKVSIVRYYNERTRYGSTIDCSNKSFILALIYEPMKEKFYFFGFPVTSNKNHYSIPFDPLTGEPMRTTSRGPNEMWAKYEYASIEDLVLKTLDS